MLNSLSPGHLSALVSLIDGEEHSETFRNKVTGPGPGNKREHLCRFGWRSQSWQDLPLPPHWLAGAPCTLRKSNTPASCNTQSMARQCLCARSRAHTRIMWPPRASRPAPICITRMTGIIGPIGRTITSTTALTRSRHRPWSHSSSQHQPPRRRPIPRPHQPRSHLCHRAPPRSQSRLAAAAAVAASLVASSAASSVAAAG